METDSFIPMDSDSMSFTHNNTKAAFFGDPCFGKPSKQTFF